MSPVEATRFPKLHYLKQIWRRKNVRLSPVRSKTGLVRLLFIRVSEIQNAASVSSKYSVCLRRSVLQVQFGLVDVHGVQQRLVLDVPAEAARS